MELYKDIEDKIWLIKQEISEFKGVSIEDIDSPSRKGEIVSARHAVVYFAYKYFKKKVSLSFIGEKSVGKDHATVLHIMKKVNNLIEVEKRTREEYLQMDEHLNIKIDLTIVEKNIKKMPSNAQLIITQIEDGEIIQNRIFYDGSVKRLSIFRDKIPVKTIDGDNALFEFKKLVNQINL